MLATCYFTGFICIFFLILLIGLYRAKNENTKLLYYGGPGKALLFSLLWPLSLPCWIVFWIINYIFKFLVEIDI